MKVNVQGGFGSIIWGQVCMSSARIPKATIASTDLPALHLAAGPGAEVGHGRRGKPWPWDGRGGEGVLPCRWREGRRSLSEGSEGRINETESRVRSVSVEVDNKLFWCKVRLPILAHLRVFHSLV